MNATQLIGRLTKDVDVRYTNDQIPVARFTLAVDRIAKKGENKEADFIPITVFGRQAETCEKYIHKGSKVAVKGRIQTGKYTNKNGDTVYTTDVIAENVEFLDSKKKDDVYEQFEMINEATPF